MKLRHAGALGLLARRARRAHLQVSRLARWSVDPAFSTPVRTTPVGPITRSLRVPLARIGADPRLETGKRHNVRLAATAFHGVVLTPATPLSFWRTLGPATRARGFTWGMELRSGCAVPAIGGGLCLLSNALFTLAVELGWSIHERHGHSLALGDAHALDATVAYPHVDLRIAPRTGAAILDVVVRGDVLVVAIHADAPQLHVELVREQRDDGHVRNTWVRRRVFEERRLVDDAVVVDDQQTIPVALKTCLDCGETACRARVTLPR
ncbi:MAG TPA: VanW family protein [Kofleriaceae bacterium]|nr:VanW family protein [Kofleriaceae bacterium]